MMGLGLEYKATVATTERDVSDKLTSDLRLLYMVPYLAGGGTEQHVLDLIERVRWSHRPWIIAPDGPSRPSVQAAGARWIEVPVLRLEHKALAAWRDAFAQAISEFDPHIVHVHAGVELLWVTRHQARKRSRVFTVHGYHGRGAGLSYRLAGILGGRLAQRVIAVSESEARRLSAVPKERLRVVLNGVSDRRLEEPPPSVADLPESAVVVAVASRLEPPKGVDVVLEAFIQLHRRRRAVRRVDGVAAEAHLVIMGTGSQERALRQRAVEAGVQGYVHLVGYEPRAAAFFHRADVVVQASRQDALPLTIAEAMAAGVPAVVSDAGGLPELVQDGVTGLVVPAGETEAWEKALAELLGDPQRRVEMGKAARQRFEQGFTVERFAAATLQVYRELLSERDAARNGSSHRPAPID